MRARGVMEWRTVADAAAFTGGALDPEDPRASIALGIKHLGVSEAQRNVRKLRRLRLDELRRIKSEQSQPMWQLRIMSAMPFLATIMLRGIAPEYPAFWSGGVGQLSLIFAWGLAVAGYFVGMRSVTRATAIAESFGITEEKVAGGKAGQRRLLAGW